MEPAFTTIVVTDAAGRRVDDGGAPAVPATPDGDASRLAVGLRRLGPGTYTVEWHATSVDTHRTQGRFTFTVALAGRAAGP